MRFENCDLENYEIKICNRDPRDPAAEFAVVDISEIIADMDDCDREHADFDELARDLHKKELGSWARSFFD